MRRSLITKLAEPNIHEGGSGPHPLVSGPLRPGDYRCWKCGQIYEKGWSEEEANAEEREIFGFGTSENENERGTLCDDCWKEFLKWYGETGSRT